MMLKAKSLTCGYGRRIIIRSLSFDLSPGEGMVLLGPNGVGKTTILRSLLGLVPLIEGEVLLDDVPLERWTRRELARRVAYVPQSHAVSIPFTVFDMVMMGRSSYLNYSLQPSHRDREEAEVALNALGIEALAERSYSELSGGERQLVLIARAMAQNPRILILDEPTANLDLGNQVRVIEQIRRLRQQGIGILMNSHVPSHALLCGEQVILFEQGGQWLLGDPKQILSDITLTRAYGVPIHRIDSIDAMGHNLCDYVPVVRE